MIPAEVIAQHIVAHPYKNIHVTVIETTKSLSLKPPSV